MDNFSDKPKPKVKVRCTASYHNLEERGAGNRDRTAPSKQSGIHPAFPFGLKGAGRSLSMCLIMLARSLATLPSLLAWAWLITAHSPTPPPPAQTRTFSLLFSADDVQGAILSHLDFTRNPGFFRHMLSHTDGREIFFQCEPSDGFCLAHCIAQLIWRYI